MPKRRSTHKRFRHSGGLVETGFGNTGVDDYELQSLSDAFEAQNEPQSKPSQSPAVQPPILDDVFQTAGNRRKTIRRSKLGNSLRKFRKKKTRGGQRALKKSATPRKFNKRRSRRSKSRRGGAFEHDWTKVGSNIVDSTLSPTGIVERARITNYNVGLPERLVRK